MAQSVDLCALCNGRTWLIVEREGGGTIAVPCDCRKAFSTPEGKIRALGVPEDDLRDAQQPVDVQVERVTTRALSFVDQGLPDPVLFVGPVGSGKSILSIRMLLRAAEKQRAWTLAWIYLPRLFVEIKSTFQVRVEDEEPATEASIIEGIVRPDFVVLDDLGAEYVTDWARTVVTMVVHERRKKRTVITSNLDLEPNASRPHASIAEVFGERLASRLGAYRRVTLVGQDLRKKYKAERKTADGEK